LTSKSSYLNTGENAQSAGAYNGFNRGVEWRGDSFAMPPRTLAVKATAVIEIELADWRSARWSPCG